MARHHAKLNVVRQSNGPNLCIAVRRGHSVVELTPEEAADLRDELAAMLPKPKAPPASPDGDLEKKKK